MEKKMFYNATPNSFEKARWLRNRSTRHEQILWDCLRKNKILGVRIRRQHPIGTYIADQELYDKERTANFRIDGLTVIRFSNDEVENDLSRVVTEITKHVRESLSSK